ncbi:TPA: hypothetical protein L4U50_003481 [Pseudomonas aeruginosa]|nr:hypothetical protein [Pseudomonas aeruginosa]
MSIELNKESVEQADASSCQGTNCGTTTGDHSSECLAEAAAGQGWELKPGDLCGRDCPIHKISVEQAGRDERAKFEYWASDEGIYPKAVERSGNCYKLAQTQSYWMAWQARAALAQPSPVRSSLLINGYQLRAALDFIAPDGTAEQLESEACIEWRQQDADFLEAGLYAFCAEYPEEGGVLLDEEPTTAQPSPLQAEQPTADDYEEVLADHRRLVRELDVLLNGEEGAAKQASLCDLVGQVAAIVRERRAPLLSPAQAGQVPDAQAVYDAFDSRERMFTSYENVSVVLAAQKRIAAAPSQAQHSVPEGFREKFEQCMKLAFAEIAQYVSPENARDPQSRARRASALATELRAMLAAAPSEKRSCEYAGCCNTAHPGTSLCIAHHSKKAQERLLAAAPQQGGRS